MVSDVDEVFKALADPTRRSLLDELFREDGQTLSALEERISMTRFGVMKHLKLLEEAGLGDKVARVHDNLWRLQWGSAFVIVAISGSAIVAIAPLFRAVPTGRSGWDLFSK